MDTDDEQIAEQRRKKAGRVALKTEESIQKEVSVEEHLELLNRFNEGERWVLKGFYDGGHEHKGEEIRIKIIGKGDNRKIALSHKLQNDWVEFSFVDLVKEVMKGTRGDARVQMLYEILEFRAETDFMTLE